LNDHLRDRLRASGRRLTSQRQLILEVLEASSKHLDADALYGLVKVHDPDISLATIYRTLAVFREMGLVREHRLGEKHSHYEAVPDEPHYHFTCLGCGEVIEFETSLVGRIEQELREQKGVSVTSTHLHMNGFCTLCQTESRESRDRAKRQVLE